MATITPVDATTAGTAVTYASASGGGDSLANAKNATLRVKNGSGSSINVTITGVRPCDQGSLHDQVIAVAAGAEKAIDIKPQFIDPTTGAAAISYSSATTVTVAATY